MPFIGIHVFLVLLSTSHQLTKCLLYKVDLGFCAVPIVAWFKVLCLSGPQIPWAILISEFLRLSHPLRLLSRACFWWILQYQRIANSLLRLAA